MWGINGCIIVPGFLFFTEIIRMRLQSGRFVCVVTSLLLLAGLSQVVVTPAFAGPNAKMLIERKGCLSCHSLNGKGGKMGPPMQTIAAWSDAERMTQYITDPKSVNPGSIMPNLRLKEEEIAVIVEFLQSFKDTAVAPKGWKPAE